jgi:hypothetical protein
MRTKQLKTITKIIGLICMFTFLGACHQNEMAENLEVKSVAESTNFKAVAKEILSKPNENNIPKDLKIIKTANVRYKVNDVHKATREIKLLSLSKGAYISDLRFENNLYRKENRFTLKVPQQSFDVLMDSIRHVVDFVEYETITTQDVTEEYLDIEARLKTKLEVKARYETVLRKQAKTVEDILKTEEKLRIIQEEIESAQGRLKYLTNKVAYSTIQIDLYQEVEYKEEPVSYKKTFWDKIMESLSFGWDMIQGLVLAILHVWPLTILGILLFIWLKRKR